MKVAHKSLVVVTLTQAAKIRTRSYIGEMKRCLSVVIALIGDPKLVILDESVRKIKTSPFCKFLNLMYLFLMKFPFDL